MRHKHKRPRRLNLALQGGGAHGAFTWGVLDRLLEETNLALDTVSAASAGAVNAVAMLSGYASGGPEAARETLDTVWQEISKAARLNPFVAGLVKVPGLVSPYTFNPLDFNPLRAILTDHVDFERLRARPPAGLIISATDVATGKARLFNEREVTADVVLASASLPTVHRAVEIEGRHYWDGGFSANPDLIELVSRTKTRDTVLVLLNPQRVDMVPRHAAEIAHHMSRLTFNQPLLRDLQEIEARRLAVQGLRRWFARPQERKLARHRFHVIAADDYTAGLAPESRLRPDWELLSHLKSAGRAEAGRWLEGATNALATQRLESGTPLQDLNAA